MWTKSHSVVTREVTKEQIWKLISNVNQWNTWDDTVEYSELLGVFEAENYFILKPNGGPKVKIKLIEVVENQKFIDLTSFPFAKMYGEHLYEETEQGLKITVTMRVKGILSFIWIKLVAQGIVNHLHEDISTQIKAAAKL